MKESNNPLSDFELRLGFENIGIHSYTGDGGVYIWVEALMLYYIAIACWKHRNQFAGYRIASGM